MFNTGAHFFYHPVRFLPSLPTLKIKQQLILGPHYLIILLLPCMPQQSSPTRVFSHHSDCNFIWVSETEIPTKNTAFTDEGSRFGIWKDGEKKPFILFPWRKQYENSMSDRTWLKKTNKQTWHWAKAKLHVWRKLLSFCFFLFFWQSPKCQRPHEWIWGLRNEEGSALRCADSDTTELNHNFQLIQQLYCLDPTAQQRQCDCTDSGGWGKKVTI